MTTQFENSLAFSQMIPISLNLGHKGQWLFKVCTRRLLLIPSCLPKYIRFYELSDLRAKFLYIVQPFKYFCLNIFFILLKLIQCNFKVKTYSVYESIDINVELDHFGHQWIDNFVRCFFLN